MFNFRAKLVFGLALGSMILLVGIVQVLAVENWEKNHEVIYRGKTMIFPVGFSEDGCYFAYVIQGFKEIGKEGEVFARMYFLNVPKNNFLKTKRIIIRGLTDSDPLDLENMVAKVLNTAAPYLKKYGITPGKNLATKVKVTKGSSKKRNFFQHKGSKFELRLIPKSYRVKRCGRLRTKIFTLALIDSSTSTQPMKVL